MSKYWSSFAATGNPNSFNDPNDPHWPQYNPNSDIVMKFDVKSQPVQFLNKQKCDEWDTIGYYHLKPQFPDMLKTYLSRTA